MGSSFMPRFDKEQLRRAYKHLRAVPDDSWNVDPDVIGKYMVETLGLGNASKKSGGTVREMGIFGKILARAAHACTEDEFIEAVETGEVPPLKLTSAEMELLRGGGCKSVIGKIAGPVLGIVGGAVLPGVGAALGGMVGGAIGGKLVESDMKAEGRKQIDNQLMEQGMATTAAQRTEIYKANGVY